MNEFLAEVLIHCRCLRQSEIDQFLSHDVPVLSLQSADLLPVVADQVVFIDRSQFEFARYVDGPSEPAFILPAIDFGEVIDLVAWQPRGDRIATCLGRAFSLGQEQLWWPTLDRQPLDVWRTPLDWLRHDRRGIVILRAEQAHFYLDHLPGLTAENLHHAEELERLAWSPRRSIPIFLRQQMRDAA